MNHERQHRGESGLDDRRDDDRVAHPTARRDLPPCGEVLPRGSRGDGEPCLPECAVGRWHHLWWMPIRCRHVIDRRGNIHWWRHIIALWPIARRRITRGRVAWRWIAWLRWVSRWHRLLRAVPQRIARLRRITSGRG